MLAQKPHLQLVGSQNLPDDEVVGTVVSKCIDEAGEAGRDTSSRPRGGRSMRVVSATSGAMAMLNPPRIWVTLRDGIHQIGLFAMVFVEKEMELIEGWPRQLPV